MNPEQVLQFVADIIDGKLIACDDGFAIEIQSPFLQHNLKDPSRHVCIHFNGKGQFEKTIVH